VNERLLRRVAGPAPDGASLQASAVSGGSLDVGHAQLTFTNTKALGDHQEHPGDLL
jgi:hypothetical protein